MPISQHSHNPKTPKSIKELFAERKKALFKKTQKKKLKPSRFTRIIDTFYNATLTFVTFILVALFTFMVLALPFAL